MGAMVTLYGKGAVLISAGKMEYRSVAGRITLPQEMANRAVAAGFSYNKPGWLAEQEEAELAAAAAAGEPAPDLDPKMPAAETAPLPDDHPQAAANASNADRLEKLRAAATVRAEAAEIEA